MEQKLYEDPAKSPVVQEIILCNRIGAIAVELAKRLNIEPVRALKLFYESKTCADLHNRQTGLYLYGDLYIADEFIREKNPQTKELGIRTPNVKPKLSLNILLKAFVIDTFVITKSSCFVSDKKVL